MSDSDIIKIPSVNSFILKNITLSRGVAKEIIHNSNDLHALYNISLTQRVSLQAVGYISRCTLKEIEEATAI